MKDNFSFHSSQHIRHKKEFQDLFQKSFRIYGGSFIYRFVFSKNDFTKLGAVSSKKFGNAVYRNKIKRIVREEFRHHYFPYPLALLINQSKPIANTNYARKELKKVFHLLSDRYFLLQCSVDSVAFKTAQFSQKMSILAKVAFHIVLFYRKYISGSLNKSCRFNPSCSVYSLEALRVYGFLKGSFLTVKRLLSCHPLGGEGYDPVPRRDSSRKDFSRNSSRETHFRK